MRDSKNRLGHGRRFTAAMQSESQTVQSEKDSCDINILVKKGAVIPQHPDQMNFDDLSGDNSFDYQEALERIDLIENSFSQLPAEMRAHFRNDPGALVAFIQNPDNLEEAQNMGLLPRPDPDPKKKASSDPDPQKKASSDPDEKKPSTSPS